MNHKLNTIALFGLSGLGISVGIAEASAQTKPNVIIVISDDQGYGDLSCTGNPWLKTPNLDQLYTESTRLTDFHVSPCCAPTRASLLTGHYTNRTGCWHTVGGRSLLRESETIIPEVLAENGWSTGMFGKWHLGDNFPFRPEDRGFEEALYLKGGGVGQLPDYWNNDYFNDTYFRSSKPEKHDGYCTDVWFDEAMKFMKEQTKSKKPFFTYLSTNAPHGPYYVANQYSDPYQNIDGVVNPYYYGMIANLDENMGKLLRFIDHEGIADNTILIFLTDNGAANGSGFGLEKGTQFVTKGYNAGMRGGKISEYEGGHRVPFFIRWPNGNIEAGKDITDLTSHIDVFPTLLDLLNIPTPDSVKFDGISLKNRLTGQSNRETVRSIVTDNQRIEYPEKWKNSSVMNQKWRLINGKELYDIATDQEQRHNVAAKHLGIVAKLTADYNSWWDDIKPSFEEYPAIAICPEQEPLTVINAMDMHPDVDNTPVPWNQVHVRNVVRNTGWVAVNVLADGKYRVSLYRYAPESNLALDAIAPDSAPERDTNVEVYPSGKKLNIMKARFSAGNATYESKVDPGLPNCTFNVKLKKGWQKFRAEFEEAEGKPFAAFYFTVERITN